MANTLTVPEIGPENSGQVMSLEEFSRAEAESGYLYELEKGVVVVVQIPGVPHAILVQYVREEFGSYRRAHKGVIHLVGGATDSGLHMPQLQSERHPDVTVYLTPRPSDPHPWDHWVPDIVVEVVSPESEHRDYVVKTDEYLKAGVKLYVIIDGEKRSTMVLRRHMDEWQTEVLDESGVLTTPLLPGFELRLADMFRELD